MIPIISPQRFISLNSPIDDLKQVLYDGKNVINYLFNFKNQSRNSLFWSIYQKMNKEFKDISGGYEFDVVLEGSKNISLKFLYNDIIFVDNEYSALGLKNLLAIIFFALFPSDPILIIEEPENHLHPELQRRLLDFLKNKTDKQYFISTHSNIFLDTAYVDTIVLVQYIDGNIRVSNATSRSLILNELGYTVADNLISDVIILTEGPSDIPVIKHFLELMGLYGRYNIKLWPLGGDIMDQLDLSVFTDKHRIIAITDRDPGSKSVRDKFMEICAQHNIPCHRLSHYSIENYFTVEALRKVFKGQISEDLQTIDPNIKLFDQIGINCKNNR